jgi:hypothetical protein
MNIDDPSHLEEACNGPLSDVCCLDFCGFQEETGAIKAHNAKNSLSAQVFFEKLILA